MSLASRLALLFSLTLPALAPAFAQTTPAPAVPEPIAQVAAGTGTASTSTCATGTANTAGANLGDGCAPATAGLAAPQGVSVDRLGNLYIADYTDRQLRVVYAAGAQLAAAITAANSGYTISATRTAPATMPTPGNIYTLAGLGASPSALTATNAAGAFYCANYAATGQPTALDALGDGCPAASAPIGPRAVQPDSDGNLFLVDYTNSRVRVLCINCAATTAAAQLITLENPGVTPANGAMYTVAGFAGGYRDAAPGSNAATAATVSVALLRSPTGLSISPAEDVYIADQGNNAVRLLYNGGAQALALLAAEGVAAPTAGYVYTIVGAGCVSAAIGKTGSVSSANSCLTTTLSADGTLGTASGVNTPWSIFLDPSQNLFFGDSGNSRYRVLAGGIATPLPLAGTTVTRGAVYSFAGAGASTANGIAPAQLALAATAAQGIAGDSSGNLFLADYVRNVIYELYANSNTLTALVGSATPATLAAGTACPAPAASTNAFGDSCPATFSKLLTPRGNLAVDAANNLYFGDSADNIVQKYAYPTFPITATGTTSPAQTVAFTFNQAITTTGFTVSPEFALTSSTCPGTVASGATCAGLVTFTPSHPGIRTGEAVLALPDGTPTAAQVFAGVGLGAALNTDLANPVTFGTTLQPTGAAIDRTGNLYVADLASESLLRYTGATPAALATGFTAPAGVAVDATLAVYVADSAANLIRKIPSISTGPATGVTPFTLLAGLSSPHGLAFDLAGNLLIANTGANQVLSLAPNGALASIVPFTGLNAPQAVAVDDAGNFYAADTGNARIVRLTPAGVQTVVANVASTGLAVDAAGDLLAFSGTSLNEYPAGATTPVTVLSGLGTPRAVAVDAFGNLAVADQAKTGLLSLNRTTAGFTFTSSPSSNPFAVTSTGNTPFTPATPFLTSSDSTHFTVVSAATNGCAGALPAGATCNLTATFAAATAGTYIDNVTYNGNATNAPGLALTGTNTAEATTTTFTASSLAVTYGTPITFTAMVLGTATTPTSGSVAFKNATTTLGTASVGANGTAATAIVLPAGMQSITATYTPSTINYAPSTSNPTVITVTPAVLNVTATSTSRQFGVANPAFTYTITGFVNNDTPASAVSGSPAETTTATNTSPQGKYPITVTQGTLTAANYTFTFTSGTLTVTPAVPVLTFTSSTTSTFGGAPVTLTATVTSTVGTPTGSVSFYSGTALLSSVPLIGNTAALITTALPTGTDSVTAFYSGDAAFASFTSNAILITVGIPFSVSASSTALNFPKDYQEAQSFLTINPGGRTDTLTFACSGLPARVSCAFTPSTLALSGLAGPQSVTLLVSNSAATAANDVPSTLTLAAGLALFLLAATRRRKLLPRLLALVLFAALAGSLAGCGTGLNAAATQQAAGSYPFTVTVSSGTTPLQAIPFTLTVQ